MRFFVVLFLLVCSFSLRASAPVKAAVVLDANTGSYIDGYNEDVKTQPASLTKMMTLLLTFKALKKGDITLNTKVRVSKNAASQCPCKLGLKEGESITVRNAILALVTKSANDVAVALSERIARGNEKLFVYLMNKEARRLKMRSTVFVNPSGWKNSKQLSTARDMAKLARALIKNYPKYYHFFATKKFSYKKAKIKNHNKLLGSHKGIIIDGIKTGYVAASGYNLAASARKGRRRLIVVVLGGETAKQRDKEVSRLLKRGFNWKKKRSQGGRLSRIMIRKRILSRSR